jgi:hypothetical protein
MLKMFYEIDPSDHPGIQRQIRLKFYLKVADPQKILSLPDCNGRMVRMAPRVSEL